MMKKTKIVCTVGPSTDELSTLSEMLKAGMNVARFNFSHGTHDDHNKRIAMVRQASLETKIPVALMLDTKGPEMRLGKFKDGKVQLVAGQKFTLTGEVIAGTKEMATVSYADLPKEVKAGDFILLSDGLISLLVDQVEDNKIITTVQNSGEISDRKRVATPGVSVNLPPLSEQDIADILFGVKQGMDCIAASFIQRAADVLAIRRVLEEASSDMLIIAKIENAAGVENIDEILKVVDGVMVARGDMGVEIPAEEVPVIQKMLIRKCNDAGKLVITATQMLESMMTNPRPTRAEASDIANAIYDGTDCIMLSGETASGKYPLEAVKMMAKIAVRTENSLEYSSLLSKRGIGTLQTTTEAISHATVQIAHELGAAAIITATESGYTSCMVSKYRPQATIVAVTPNESTLRRLLLRWGVCPLLGPSSKDSDQMVNNAVASALFAGVIKDGDLVIITAGVPVGTVGTTNMIRAHVVGNVLMRGTGVGQKSVTGKVCIVKSEQEIKEKFKAGDILVVPGIDERTASYATQAGAIIAEEGGFTSQAAIVGVSYGMPVIVGVDGAVDRLTDGSTVTVDASRGLIYQGEINAR